MSKSEKEKSFTNYNLVELIHINDGINVLIKAITNNDLRFDEKQLESFHHILLLQSDIQNDIISKNIHIKLRNLELKIKK